MLTDLQDGDTYRCGLSRIYYEMIRTPRMVMLV